MASLEICVDSVHSLDAAVDGTADSIELCSALSIGGLTPSLGLLAYLLTLFVLTALSLHIFTGFYIIFRDICSQSTRSIPIMVMIRPRLGDFCYSNSELESMLNDIKLFIGEMKDRAEDGFVFGCLLQ